jgi:U4/U6 small nuclear ribonucleoprotein PRP4
MYRLYFTLVALVREPERFLNSNSRMKKKKKEMQKLLEQEQLERASGESVLEKRRRARALVLPTNDDYVKGRLRELCEPICLFGEDLTARRERLRECLASRNETRGMPLYALELNRLAEVARRRASEEDSGELFYTRGTQQLLHARTDIAEYARHSASERFERLEAQRNADLLHVEQIQKELAGQSSSSSSLPSLSSFERRKRWLPVLGNVELCTSVAGDSRALSSCAFGDDGQTVVAGSWSGRSRVWRLGTDHDEDVRLAFNLRGHSDRVNDVLCFRRGGGGRSMAATCSADGDVRLYSWTLDDGDDDRQHATMVDDDGDDDDKKEKQIVSDERWLDSIATLSGHAYRVNRLAMHPSQRFLLSSSHDMTWRLWDVAGERELLQQEGHARPVFGIAVHPDGSLAASTCTGAIGRLWDLRSGRAIWAMRGHAKSVLSVAFAPDGFRMATGGADHQIRLWDLRNRECDASIPAHFSQVSRLCYGPGNSFVASSGYDHAVKFWSAGETQRLACALGSHTAPVTGLAMHPHIELDKPETHLFVTSSLDRTLKLWRPRKIN